MLPVTASRGMEPESAQKETEDATKASKRLWRSFCFRGVSDKFRRSGAKSNIAFSNQKNRR
jgi:hypothetical protein